MFLAFKLYTYAKLNCLKYILKFVYMYKNRFGIKWPTMVDMSLNQTKPNQTFIWL